MREFWEKFYGEMPLEDVPWQKTQADWFKELVDEEIIRGETALDLGCGTAKKSVYLVQEGGFERVTAIDVSPTAIEYAKQNVINNGLTEQIELRVEDMTELSFLGDRTFDFVLDWAALHGVPPKKRESYVQNIVPHTHNKSQLLLRVFSQKGVDKSYFEEEIEESSSRIYLFTEEMIEKLYSPYFDVVETNYSKPRTKDNLQFLEVLMERKIDN